MLRSLLVFRLLPVVLGCFALGMGAVAVAEGSAEAGAGKAVTCTACHGADGNSVNSEWPNLAGQHPRYLIKQLEAYQNGKRPDITMSAMANGLSAADIDDLAAYYSTLGLTQRTADPALVAQGERLYRGGNPATGVPACIACHGPSGSGNAPAAYPVIRGQHTVYVIATLRDYAAGARRSDDTSAMPAIAERLSDEEIETVAAYIQGLRPTQLARR